MEKLNLRMVRGLAEWADVEVVGPSGAESLLAPLPVCEVAPAPLRAFVPAAAVSAIATARRVRPQLVVAGSGLTAPMVWMAARAVGARSAAYVHGLDLIAPHVIYRSLWIPAIRAMDVVVANSRNTASIAMANGVQAARLSVVNPGTDLASPRPGGRERFRSQYGFGDAPVLLSVGRLTARKGLLEFVTNALPAIAGARPDVVLAVIGNEAPDALHRVGGGSAALLEAASRAGVASAVRLLGPCSDDALDDAYAGADLHVFPVRAVKNDVEGFGMVAIEAAAHGLATVAFDVGGVGDAITPDTGALLPPEDYPQMIAVVLRHLEGRHDRERCRSSAVAFAWSRFDNEIRQILEPQCGL
ncbi:glycosyltransferase family 4 protein [Lysobacter sp. TY2-98]|uniref:glycosyltransferase family 4 protein n=1 Tax=Lysobacter sp. TY2-98 TaxID=2290922 RepID=UPI0013B35836|nr:glycosyltransferase family 4 protein [Lysobacter sp. TY2-98]